MPTLVSKDEPASGLDCSGGFQSRAGYPSKRAGSRWWLCTAATAKGQGRRNRQADDPPERTSASDRSRLPSPSCVAPTRREQAGVSRSNIVNRPVVEFCVGSSDQRRPQPRSRRARSAGAPPSVSRRAAPQYIGRRCVVHAPTRVKQFPGRTWASLVHLQRTGPLAAAIYESPPLLIEGIDTGDLFHDVFAGEGILFHPRFAREPG